MRRRHLVALVAGAPVLLPLAAAARPAERMRHVGVLLPFPDTDPLMRRYVTAFADGLARAGWVEGKTIRIDYRFAGGDLSRLDRYAAELVRRSPDAMLAGTPQAIAALRQQTRTIPIVFLLVIDPVGLGLVQSLARPGGKITGFSAYNAPLTGKWLQLLKEIAPGVRRVAVLFNPDAATTAPLFTPAIEAAAGSVGIEVKLAPVHDDAAIAAEASEAGGSLISLPGNFTTSHRELIIAAATRHRLPLVCAGEAFVKAGALLSYWFDPVVQFSQAGSYIDRILRGADPADLPVQEPQKFSLTINLKTARALGLSPPPSLLARADEVIE